MYEHAGHRQRLREKIRRGEACEHELLEAFLFDVIPRRNTNDIAHRLLAEFGDMEGVFNASKSALMEVKGIGEQTASYIVNYNKKRQEELQQRKRAACPEFYEPDSFRDYLMKLDNEVETLSIYSMDENGRFFHVQNYTMQDAEIVSIDGYIISKHLIKTGARGVVITHNHPSGKVQPSMADDKATMRFQAICRINGVLLCDHIIYTNDATYSYYNSGKLSVIGKMIHM